jgi:hypothetical protein
VPFATAQARDPAGLLHACAEVDAPQRPTSVGVQAWEVMSVPHEALEGVQLCDVGGAPRSFTVTPGQPRVVALGATFAGAAFGWVATIAITVVLSLLSFRFFEKPTNDWLRTRFLPARPKAPAAGVSHSV